MATRVASLAFAFAFVLSSVGGRAAAQAACDAGCDRVIEPAERSIDGADVAPGEVVCVRGGETATLTIRDVHGSADAPVVIRACDAPLSIGGGGATNGIAVQRSSHLRITGGDERAIRIVGGPTYSVGVSVQSCTEHLEVDGLEVSGTSYTAYRNLSESDTCPVRTGFSLHHWFIHDVGGEGMFFGANLASSPYRLLNVEVYANRIERTGMQGIKIGTTVDDAYVHHNWVIEAGTRAIGGEDTGITGSASTFRIEQNIVLRPTRSCIFAGGPDLHVIDNLLIGCGDAAMSTNGSATTRTRVLHNTMVGMAGPALNMWASDPSDCAFANNLVVDLAEGRTLGIRDGERWRVTGNLMLTTDEAGFADVIDVVRADFAALDVAPFALAAGSVAIDAGSTDFADEVPSDILGEDRDAQPDVGAHEWRAPEPDAGATPDAGAAIDAAIDRDVGEPAPDAGGAAVPPASSAGCAVSPRTGGGARILLLLLLAFGGRRARSRAQREASEDSPTPGARRRV